MLINNFNSLFELAAALNIGYASITQLAEVIKNYSFRNIFNKIESLEQKSTPVLSKIQAITHDAFTDEKKEKLYKKVQRELQETQDIKKEINDRVDTANKSIAHGMRKYFILVAIMSISFMVLGGFFIADTMPLKKIIDIYIIAFLYIIIKNILNYQLKWEKTFFVLTIIIAVLVCYFGESYLLQLVNFLNPSETFIMSVMLCTMTLPFLITLILYFVKSKNILNEYDDVIQKQDSEITEQILMIEKVATAPETAVILEKLTSEEA